LEVLALGIRQDAERIRTRRQPESNPSLNTGLAMLDQPFPLPYLC
jgi:hypothetical protein